MGVFCIRRAGPVRGRPTRKTKAHGHRRRRYGYLHHVLGWVLVNRKKEFRYRCSCLYLCL